MTQQKGFKWTVRVLRQFANLLSKTVVTWETFKDGEIRYFYGPQNGDSAGVSSGSYLAAIDKDVIELKDLLSSLQYQTDLFENMITNASFLFGHFGMLPYRFADSHFNSS